MKLLINYGHNGFEHSQALNEKSGLEKGGFTHVTKYRFGDLGQDFTTKNNHILSQSRGAGYWLWKPYFILENLKKMNEGDILCYSDAAITFLGDMGEYFDECINDEKGIVLFFNASQLNYQWTKRDCFVLMEMDGMSPPGDPTPCGPYARQANAAIQICRKTDFSISFYEEYLKLCEDERILTDIPNTQGKPNYEGFRDHRHDQSILSLLRFKYKVRSREDICQWGREFRQPHEKELLDHHRRKF